MSSDTNKVNAFVAQLHYEIQENNYRISSANLELHTELNQALITSLSNVETEGNDHHNILASTAPTMKATRDRNQLLYETKNIQAQYTCVETPTATPRGDDEVSHM